MANRGDVSVESERRYTDQEVALVLQRAAEIEERRAGSAPAHGLTLRELQEIARDVGLRPEVFAEAIAMVEHGEQPRQLRLGGAPASHKVVRGIRGRLTEENLRELVGVVEEEVDATGTVTEALGTVRWTSVGRGRKLDRSTQIAFTVKDTETQIQVVQRYPPGMWTVLHLVPGLWGGGVAAGLVASAQMVGAAAVAIPVGGILLGVGVGRAIWQFIARRSARETRRLADQLALAAGELAGSPND